MPRGDSGAGQRRRFLKTQMIWKLHEPLGAQADLLGKHSIQRTTQSRGGLGIVGWPIEPSLHEYSGNPIPRFYASNAFPDAQNLTRAIRKRNQGRLHRPPVPAL